MFSYYITSLLNTAASASLGIFVLIRNTKNSLNRSLFILNVTVAFWSLFLFLHYASNTLTEALLTSRLLHVAAILIPPAYLCFIVNLLELNKKKVVRAFYLISLIFLILSFSPSFVSGVEPKLFFKFYATAGRLYIFWIASYLLITGYGIYLILKNYPGLTAVKKIQAKYVLLASFLGFAGGATIYPLFYNIPMPPLGEHIIFIYPIIITTAVIKHNLLDLNIVIKHTIVYSASVLLITILYLVTILLLERFLRNTVGYQSVWVTLTAAIVIALIFTPLKNKVQSIVDKVYVSSAYKRLEKELFEADKRKAVADFAAGMAHEIRNPLTAIKTFAEYLPVKFNDAKFRENFSKKVVSEVNRIDSLIVELLEFAKPYSLIIAEHNIHDTLDYTLNLLSSEMIKTDIKLVRNYKIGHFTRQCDANKLKHAFLNIIKNAIEAMAGGGILTISTYDDNDRLKIDITDTGRGINEAELNKIFEPFYSTKQKGAGLGLCIAQRIITEHNGILSVKSSLNNGTTFTITL